MLEVHVRHGDYSATNNYGLTDEGKLQAKAAATYIRTHFPAGFDTGIHSGSRRAIETAEMLDQHTIAWIADDRLREADWRGKAEPRTFEPWIPMFHRVSSACREWDAQADSGSRIVVSHGGTMRMVRAYREQLTSARFPLLFQDPYKYFTNCQIIIYTDKDPVSNIVSSCRLWVKSVCPWNEGRYGHDWLVV